MISKNYRKRLRSGLWYSLSGKIKKFDFHPGNLSMSVYTCEKPPTKKSGLLGHPLTRAIKF